MTDIKLKPKGQANAYITCHYSGGSATIIAGWTAFVLQNEVEEDDKFKFGKHKTKRGKWLVTIFRSEK